MYTFRSDSFQLETERLIIRRFTIDDLDACIVMEADPDVLRFTNCHGGGEDSLSSLQRIIRQYDNSDLGIWAVVLKEENSVIGYVGLKYLPGTQDIEILYRTGKKHWGCNLAAEACREIIRYAFEVLRIGKIVAASSPSNTPSPDVLESIGMKFCCDTRHYDMEIKMYSLDNPQANWDYMF